MDWIVFYQELTPFGLEHINRGVDHYGLSLILGGAESTLWDLCKTYAGLAATVNHYTETSSEYYPNEFQSPSYFNNFELNLGVPTSEKNTFDAGSIYLAFESMLEVNRPEGDQAWKFYDSSKKIAWKTGTSFGNRDAWAIGASPTHVVGVWVGNADGEGRPDLTGVNNAGPVLFDLFNILPKSPWFTKPYDELVAVDVCDKSGYLAQAHCASNKQWIPQLGKRSKPCPYHQLIHVDKQQQYRVNASCENLDNITTTSWFVLPPLMAWYYKRHDANYKNLPPVRPNCSAATAVTMDFIFPKTNGKIILAKNELGELNDVIFKIAHSKPDTKVFWYLDEVFLQTTETFHEIAILPSSGEHLITVVDALGNEIKKRITIER
jgi:penicillin-binding protein 1C